MQTDVLIIGAGFSGLAAARAVAQTGASVRVLEARDRIGGRALSVTIGNSAVDLGPAWIWPQYQPLVAQLARDLGIALLEQFETGDFVFETHSGLRRGIYPRRYSDARRVRGGLQGLTRVMADTLPTGSVEFATTVLGIDASSPAVTVHTDRGDYRSQCVICAAPGQLARHWSYSPTLPRELHNALRRWPTWMAAQAKIMALYDKPFWRELGLSGSSGSQIGPLIETADQSDPDNGLYALFGFVGWPAQERERQCDALEAAIIDQLVRLVGQRAAQPQAFYFQDWAREPLTASPFDLNAGGGHPPYGEPAWSKDWFDGRVFFAGAEGASMHGGLIEGALAAGEHAADQALGALAI